MTARRPPLVVVTDYIEPDLEWEREQVEQLGARFESYQCKHGSPDELVEIAGDADVVIVNMARLDERVLRKLSRCRLVIRHGVGYDNVDVRVAAELGIAVARVPDYCIAEVAEQALMLIFACQRKLPLQMEITERSAGTPAWDFASVYPVHSLREKTLGVVGCGRIGTALLQMAAGLGMRRIAVDPLLAGPPPYIPGVEFATLDALLARADVISLHVPLDDDTRGLFSEPQFQAMKPSAALVNTSRGEIVDLAALDRALREGELAAAGIDVYDLEPPEASLALLSNPRAICTPHLGWLSEEARWRIRELIVEDVRRFLAGDPPRVPVQ